MQLMYKIKWSILFINLVTAVIVFWQFLLSKYQIFFALKK